MRDFQSIAAMAVVVLTLLIIIAWKLRKKEGPCEDCCCSASPTNIKSSNKKSK